MTAKELIAQLRQLPSETRVIVRGYEDGYNDIAQLKPVRIIRQQNPEWYYGEYAASDSPEAIAAIELFGENTINKQ